MEEPFRPALRPGRLILLLATSLLLFHLLLPLVRPLGTTAASLLLPAAAFLLPSFLWSVRRGNWGRVFPFRPLSFPAFLRAAALAAGASLTALATAALLFRLFPSSGAEEETLRHLVRSVPPPGALFLFALWPALCEEALFRGALLDGLRGLPAPAVCLLSGAVFGLFHGSFLRFLPVALLGAALAAVVLRTGNWGLAVLFHALHNGAILLFTAPAEGAQAPVVFPAVLGGLLVLWGLGPFRGAGRGEGGGGVEGGKAQPAPSSEPPETT